jgi:hypothetical protein
MQSGGTQNKKRVSQATHSKLIQKMGGTAVLDFLAIAFSERIAEDHTLQSIYGKLTLKALIQLQKELLLFAFSDDQDAFLLDDDASNNNILYRHCKLGLMVDPVYFESLFQEYLEAICDCTQVEETMVECGSRFSQLHPLLMKETHRQIKTMQAEKKQQEKAAQSSPILEETRPTDGMQSKKKKEEKNPSKRLSFLRGLLRDNAAQP